MPSPRAFDAREGSADRLPGGTSNSTRSDTSIEGTRAEDDDSTAELASRLRHAVLRLTRRLRSQRVDISVTITQLMALGTLAKHGPMSAGELAAHERVQPPSMTKILVALEDHGLSRREPHPSDRRQIVIEVTEAGRGLIEQEGRMRDAWLAVQLAALSAEDLSVLERANEVMTRLATD